ncbi:MAG: prepilin-type N-terminal cleavage/methylation domain-containing protein [Eubacteriales bacterium]|nr:prepilin-type N-terminal cleavage/methylation domain-containing protein [Eubacteriales bacterium]
MPRSSHNKRKKLHNQGMTLVEMIVTFALLSIFMVCATMIISATVQTYHRSKGLSYGMQVGDMLVSRITKELESAQCDVTKMEKVAGEEVEDVAMLVEKNVIQFTNKQGSHVSFELVQHDGRQYLAEKYYEVRDEGGNVASKEILWTFDDKAYMGYEVKNMEFIIKDADHPSIVCVALTLDNGTYGQYEINEYIECYQFDNSEKESYIKYYPD